MEGSAKQVEMLWRGAPVPEPTRGRPQWPSGFQTHAQGPLWVTSLEGRSAMVSCDVGQYHIIAVRSIDWERSHALHKGVTLLWV